MTNKILAFMNSYSQGSSGGDVVFATVMSMQKNVEWTVITSALGKTFCKAHNVKARYIITSTEKRFAQPIQTYITRIRRALAMKLHQPDLVYTSSDVLPDTLPAWVISKRNHIPWIARTYHIVSGNRILSRLTQEVSIQLMKHSTAVITASKGMKEQLVRRGIQSEKIHIIYPGISPKTVTKTYTNKKYDAVFMARIHPSKGIVDLISMWKKVRREIPDARVAIIGAGEEKYMNELKTMIDTNSLAPSIELLGYVPDEKAFDIISKSKVFLHPSHEEGFGMIIGEVLSVGTPIVAYRLPVFVELFKNAIDLIPPYDVEQFADCVITKINQPKKKLTKTLLPIFNWRDALTQEQRLIDEIASR